MPDFEIGGTPIPRDSQPSRVQLQLERLVWSTVLM